MDPTDTLQGLLTVLQSGVEIVYSKSISVNVEQNLKELELFYPHILAIVQRSPDFFTDERILFGTNLSLAYETSESIRDEIWKNLQMCIIASFMSGDITGKIGTIIGTVKSLWSASGQTSTEVDTILNDEKTEANLQELFGFVSNLRTAKVFMEILEEIDVPSLGVTLDNPMELMAIVRDPSHPTMQKCMHAVKRILKEKAERGQLTQQQLTGDIEAVKLKVQSLFGDVFNEALGGRKSDVSSAVMVSNDPEARRQRMLARLQRKQREKTQR
jgi:hypothetical protein